MIKKVVDTNVPKNANRAINPLSIPNEELNCVEACVLAIESIVNNGGLVLDSGDEIFDEYRVNLSLSGIPGQGDRFMKWVHDNRWTASQVELVEITKVNNSYEEFPNHAGLEDFDISDRKFIAVANAHPDRPPILEATDSKWWGWRAALEEVGITVEFLCDDWIKQKHAKKMGE